MEIYLLRHAIAAEHDPDKYPDDSKRPLTDEGRDKMRAGARGIKALGLSFDLVLSSPYPRARETARITLQALGIKENAIVLSENLVPDAAFETLVREINARLPQPKRVLCVGHEPHLSGFVSFLLAGKQHLTIDFKKGGLCCLSAPKLAAGNATLHWLLTPAQLRSIH